MRKMAYLSAVAAVAGVLSTPMASHAMTPPPPETGFEVLHSALQIDSGDYTNKGYTTLESQAAYRDTLARYSSQAPKSVDFSQNTVLLLDMGQRSSGGYAIRVNKVQEMDGYTQVQVTYVEPGKGCVTNAALSNPYKFIRVPTTEDILVDERIKREACN